MERREVGWTVASVARLWWAEEGVVLYVGAPSEVVQSGVTVVSAPSEMTQRVCWGAGVVGGEWLLVEWFGPVVAGVEGGGLELLGQEHWD